MIVLQDKQAKASKRQAKASKSEQKARKKQGRASNSKKRAKHKKVLACTPPRHPTPPTTCIPLQKSHSPPHLAASVFPAPLSPVMMMLWSRFLRPATPPETLPAIGSVINR